MADAASRNLMLTSDAAEMPPRRGQVYTGFLRRRTTGASD
jgi:hypothetical protein